MPAMRTLIASLLLAALSTTSLASVEQIAGTPCTLDGDHDLTESDQYRINHLFTARTMGLAQAMRAENADDRAYVSDMFQAGLYPVSFMPAGLYRCRTIKLGGLSDLIIYQWFECAVGADEDGTLTLRKTTGSQNFVGTLQPAGAGLLFRGAGHYGYEDDTRRYGDDEERNEVGCLTKDAEDGTRFVLEEPFPQFESLHDIIELQFLGS